MFIGDISIVIETVSINFKECNGHRMFSIFLGYCSTETWLVGIGLGTGIEPRRWPAIAQTKTTIICNAENRDATKTDIEVWLNTCIHI